MPIGKDSIKTRVAKVSAPEEEAPKTETAAEATAEVTSPAPEAPPAETKPAPKKRTTSGTTRKKPTTPKVAEEAAVETAVLSNVAPETVEAVVGHKEDAKVEHVQVGQKMPHYLL